MRKLTCAGVLCLFVSLAGKASAALIYDGFSYTPGNLLSAQTNPGNSLNWSAMGPETDDNTIVNDNLSVPGLATSTGNATGYGGSGKTVRLALGATAITSGSVYYSLAFKLTDLTNLPTTGAFVAGLNNSSGTSGSQPTTILARMVVKPGSVSGTYQIGMDRSSGSAGNFVFDGIDRNLNDTQFVVAAWDIVTGGSNDVARMWINPSSANFGAAVDPAPTITIANPGSQADANILSFLFKQSPTSSVIVPAGIVADELRVDTTWAGVTPPVPEPAVIGSITVLAAALLQRRSRV